MGTFSFSQFNNKIFSSLELQRLLIWKNPGTANRKLLEICNSKSPINFLAALGATDLLKSCSKHQKNNDNRWSLLSANSWRILFWWQEIIKNFSAALGATENKFDNSDNNQQEFTDNPEPKITLPLKMINFWKSWKIENIHWRDCFGNWKVARIDPSLQTVEQPTMSLMKENNNFLVKVIYFQQQIRIERE